MPVSSASQCQSTFGMNGMEWRFAGGAPIPVNPKAPPPDNNTITITGNISVKIYGSHAYHIRTFLSRD